MFFEHDWHGLFVRVRKYFAEPPDAASNTQNKTEGADRNAREKARKQ
jgi:hypothetical protein